MASIEGWAEIQRWMGLPTTFHDGEITEVILSTSGPCTLLVNVRGRIGDTRTVKLELFPPFEVSLSNWLQRNIVLEMTFLASDELCTIVITSSQGADGELKAKRARVTFA